ncbi:hypothetical protein HID58_047856 [Brassica napus]|uniref:MAPK kinase substrate protein n=1 Tax=Brassica napus TaxID=3708 RepID=A0ABQ8B0P3_BRANA|nr:hypothetical protein HID58_047856 [Brassica napus]
MAGLQRSNISFRRQGSSGIVWDDRLIAELNKQANEHKAETDEQEGQEDQTARPTSGGGIEPIRTEGRIERSRSNGGGANRHHRNTGRVSPAVDPPSPRLSAFGCCSAFGKKPVKQQKRPPKRRSSTAFGALNVLTLGENDSQLVKNDAMPFGGLSPPPPSVLKLLRNVTNSKKATTEKRRSMTLPSNGNKPESKPTIHDHDVDKSAEAFIQNFRRQLLLQGDD